MLSYYDIINFIFQTELEWSYDIIGFIMFILIIVIIYIFCSITCQTFASPMRDAYWSNFDIAVSLDRSGSYTCLNIFKLYSNAIKIYLNFIKTVWKVLKFGVLPPFLPSKFKQKLNFCIIQI